MLASSLIVIHVYEIVSMADFEAVNDIESNKLALYTKA